MVPVMKKDPSIINLRTSHGIRGGMQSNGEVTTPWHPEFLQKCSQELEKVEATFWVVSDSERYRQEKIQLETLFHVAGKEALEICNSFMCRKMVMTKVYPPLWLNLKPAVIPERTWCGNATSLIQDTNSLERWSTSTSLIWGPKPSYVSLAISQIAL